MNRILKIIVAFIVLISGLVAFFLDKIEVTELGAFYGAAAIFMQIVEKYIQPKKEQQAKDEILQEVADVLPLRPALKLESKIKV